MTDPTSLAVHDVLARNREAQTRFLAELVKVPSDNPPGDCQRHADRAAELREGLGCEAERHAVPADVLKANGMVSASNLTVREHFGPGPTIALNAHGDVVPPGLGWSMDPFGAVIEDGLMHGRGVAVSKSDVATFAHAPIAPITLKASGAKLNGTAELHHTFDEAAGGLIGPGCLPERRLSKPDHAICAGFAHGVTTAHSGCPRTTSAG